MSATSEGVVLAERYRLLDQVAAGAMGEVWRAHDDRLDRDVAVKVLRPELAEDPTFLERFRVEARHAASVRHPHVATVHDYGEDPAVRTGGVATAYLVMDLLDGRPLHALLAEVGVFPEKRVAVLCAQVADALSAAHRIGLVHRDIKPANLVVSAFPIDEITVTDFGIARAADAVPVTRTGLVMGTAEYLSPEQARGERASTASDVYSLGVVAYELLTSHPPFSHPSPAETARAHVHDPVPALPREVGVVMSDTVMRCLRKIPSQRPDADALAIRLRSIGDGSIGNDGAGCASTVPDPAWTAVPEVSELAQPASSADSSATDVPVGSGTQEIPVVGRPRRPLRAPLIALLALLALLLLATALQGEGLIGTQPVGSGTNPHVTGSGWTTINKDGR